MGLFKMLKVRVFSIVFTQKQIENFGTTNIICIIIFGECHCHKHLNHGILFVRKITNSHYNYSPTRFVKYKYSFLFNERSSLFQNTQSKWLFLYRVVSCKHLHCKAMSLMVMFILWLKHVLYYNINLYFPREITQYLP